MDINDDCLLEIFKHLTVEELAAVADVSSRLRSMRAWKFREFACRGNL